MIRWKKTTTRRVAFLNRKILCRLCLACVGFHIFSFFSCGSTPESQPEALAVSDVIDVSEAVSVPVAVPKKKSFFSAIKEEDMEAIESGAPQSLRKAYSSIHKSVEEDYTDAERTLIYVMEAMMKYAWPSEQCNFVVPKILSPNQYTGAVDSVKKGIYDLSSGSSDFISLVVPSLVILSSDNMTEYYDRTEQSLKKALALKPDSVLANYMMGFLSLKKNIPQEALRYLNVANGKYSSGTKEILYSIAESCIKNDNMDLALTMGEQLLKRFPQDTAVLDLCAKSAYALGDLDKTESYVVRILLLEPDNTDYVLFRAGILMKKQDFIRTSSLLDVCARKNQTPKEYYVLRTRLQCDWNKNYTAAAETVSKAISIYPDDRDIQLLTAEVASLTAKPINGMTAMEIARKVLEKDPENIKAKEICVSELYKSGDYQQSYAMSSKLISGSNVSRSILYSHIDICLALRKTTEAGNLAERIYRESPDDEDSQMAYIKVLASSGKVSSAMQLIERLLPDANSKMKSFLYYERSFLQSTDDQVLSDLRSSLTSNPRNKESLYRLYQIYYNKKDWRRAQYYLKQVVALDPANSIYVRQNSELEKLLKR